MKNDMYNTYSNTDFEYYYKYSFKERNQSYLEMQTSAIYTWEYDEPISLCLDIQSELTTGNPFLTIYNFRYEKIMSDIVCEIINNQAIVNIVDTSLLMPGIYYYSIQNEVGEYLQEPDSDKFLYVR